MALVLRPTVLVAHDRRPVQEERQTHRVRAPRPRRRQDALDQGSGVLVRGQYGRVFVLTAHHVVDVADPLYVAHPEVLNGNHALVVESSSRRSHPEAPSVDVAMIALGEAASAAFLPYAIELYRLAGDSLFQAAEFGVIAGYPKQFFKDGAHGSTAYMTKFKGRDAAEMSFAWDNAITRDGAVVNLKRGVGVSGGAAWRFRHPRKDTDWNPSDTAAVVGLAHRSTGVKAQLAVPIERWGAWVLSELSM